MLVIETKESILNVSCKQSPERNWKRCFFCFDFLIPWSRPRCITQRSYLWNMLDLCFFCCFFGSIFQLTFYIWDNIFASERFSTHKHNLQSCILYGAEWTVGACYCWMMVFISYHQFVSWKWYQIKIDYYFHGLIWMWRVHIRLNDAEFFSKTINAYSKSRLKCYCNRTLNQLFQGFWFFFSLHPNLCWLSFC